jgi:indoleamine 2,3-dioxygenase
VQQRSADIDLRTFALDLEAPESAAVYLHALNQVRDFRWRHWCFTREFILKKSGHPTATGGSPIVTWLPNQLQAVLDQMAEVWERFDGRLPNCQDIMDTATNQRRTLQKEVSKYCQERKVDVPSKAAGAAADGESAREIEVQ